MEKKRLVGVTIFAVLFIIGGLLSLLSALDIKSYLRDFRMGILTFPLYALTVAVPVSSVIAGIFLFKLKPWVRKLVIIMTIANIILMLNFLKLPSTMNASMERDFARQEENIQSQLKPELQQKALEQLKIDRQLGKKAVMIIVAILFSLSLAWNLIVLFYFTRPRVKEQLC